MKTKKLMGYGLISLPFIFLIGYDIYDKGLVATIFTCLLLGLFFGALVTGFKLVGDEDEH